MIILVVIGALSDLMGAIMTVVAMAIETDANPSLSSSIWLLIPVPLVCHVVVTVLVSTKLKCIILPTAVSASHDVPKTFKLSRNHKKRSRDAQLPVVIAMAELAPTTTTIAMDRKAGGMQVR
jgi:hypothetical protein